MDQDERRKPWTAEAAVYEITRFFPIGSIAKKVPGLRNVEGVETWVELHLRPLQKSMDMTREATIWTREGKAYPVCIEGTAHVNPTFESVQAGIWRPGDWLVQEKNARKRAARKRKSTPD